MSHPDPIESPSTSDNTVGKPGVASGTLVTTNAEKSWKQTPVEKLSNRHRAVTFDSTTGYRIEKRIKQRNEHHGQTVLCLGYKEDLRRGTEYENSVFGIFVSADQEVWAAEGREAAAQWIKARDLVVGRHVLKLAYAGNPWAELAMVEVPKQAEWRDASVHELVLEDSDSYTVQSVLCRATSIPSKVVKKRVVYPLKDYPIINYVPQPKALMLVYAEVWYRKTASLLPQCVDQSLEPVARLKAVLALKERLRDVAAKAGPAPESGWNFQNEFIAFHQIPTFEELLPQHEGLSAEALAQAVEAAIAKLSEPGPRKYCATTGGEESHHVVDFSDGARWDFGEQGWIRREKTENLTA